MIRGSRNFPDFQRMVTPEDRNECVEVLGNLLCPAKAQIGPRQRIDVQRGTLMPHYRITPANDAPSLGARGSPAFDARYPNLAKRWVGDLGQLLDQDAFELIFKNRQWSQRRGYDRQLESDPWFKPPEHDVV